MAKTSTSTRVRRTDEQLIADLQAKIAHLKNRAEQKKAKRDPALRHVSAALRSLNKAKAESEDQALQSTLERAANLISDCLAGAVAGDADAGDGVRPQLLQTKPARPEVLLEYIRKNPGLRGEQIGAALGFSAAGMRPAMRELIEDKKVKTKGQRRGMTYFPA